MKRKRISTDIISGIYSITNKINNKIYIGSSKDVYGRWVQHENELSKNKHHNFHLQNAWNKYGKECFLFEIVELCDEKDLFINEQKWYDFYNSGDEKFGYNLSDIARCPSYRATINSLKKGKQTISYEQFIEIISLLENTDISIPKIAEKTNAPERTIYQIYFKDQYKELTKDCKFIQRKNDGNAILSKEQVIAIIERLKKNEFNSDIAKDYDVSTGTIDDIRQHKTWCELTEGIAFDSIKNRKRPHHKDICQYTLDGNYVNTYSSAREAEKQTGVGYKLISQVCNGEKRMAHGFVWRFKGDAFDKYNTEVTHSVKVDQYDKDGLFIKTWNSKKEIETILNINVSAVLKGRTKSAGGFYWCKHGEKFSVPRYQRDGRKLA